MIKRNGGRRCIVRFRCERRHHQRSAHVSITVKTFGRVGGSNFVTVNTIRELKFQMSTGSTRKKNLRNNSVWCLEVWTTKSAREGPVA